MFNTVIDVMPFRDTGVRVSQNRERELSMGGNRRICPILETTLSPISLFLILTALSLLALMHHQTHKMDRSITGLVIGRTKGDIEPTGLNNFFSLKAKALRIICL